MTTRTPSCTEILRTGEAPCGGHIRPSYIGLPPVIGGALKKGDMLYPAACELCGKIYDDIVLVGMTQDDLKLIEQRLSVSTRQQLAATEKDPGLYELTEHQARDLAAKAANLGLTPLASKVRAAHTRQTSQSR